MFGEDISVGTHKVEILASDLKKHGYILPEVGPMDHPEYTVDPEVMVEIGGVLAIVVPRELVARVIWATPAEQSWLNWQKGWHAHIKHLESKR